MDALSCLAPTPALHLPTTSFADARALHFSSSISSAATAESSSSTTTASFLLADHLQAAYAPPSPHHLAARDSSAALVTADASPPRRRSPARKQQHLAPAAGRAGKRRSRASKRAPTTYISTDAANFRLMVQHITGADADSEAPSSPHHPAATLDALLAADIASGGGASLLPAAVGDYEASSALQLHQQQPQLQQPCFPTLDSWNVVMYESATNDLL